MGAETKRDMMVVAAGHVEAVWFVEGPFVGVGRRVHKQYLVALPQNLAVQLMVHHDCATHVEYRARVPDELLHCRRPDNRRVRYQDLVLVREADEIPYRLAYHRPRCLRAAVQQA